MHNGLGIAFNFMDSQTQNIMDKEKELLKIIRSYEDSSIVTENLEGCIADTEYVNLAQSIIKFFAIPDVVGRSEQLCDHEYVCDNSQDYECMKRTCEKCGHKDA